MSFPKKLMSISELVNLGFPRATLAQYSRVKNAPIIKTAGGGKVFFVTDKLIEFMDKMEEVTK